jgi:hypothetical protein
MRKLKFMILISLFAASCMTANEKSSCEEKTITVHDTVKVAKVDTLRLHDTLTVTKRDTLKTLVHDTLRIHDTTRVITHDTILAGLPDPQNLFGVWTGTAGGKSITIAFTSTLVTIHAADFSANIGSVAQSGYIGQVDSAQAKVTWAGYHDVTWLMDFRNGNLMIQEIGDPLFPAGGVTLRKR